MKVAVIYSSLTGNTKKVADKIYDCISFEKSIYKANDNFDLEEFDVVVLGYWVNKGICDENIQQVIENINNKKVILFGTLGAFDSGNYYEGIKKRIEELVSSDNEILGHFLCQGKINEKLTERYKEMQKKNPKDEHIKEQLNNHKEASKHPNIKDLENAQYFTKECLAKIN